VAIGSQAQGRSLLEKKIENGIEVSKLSKKKNRKNTCFLQTCKELRVESPTKQKIKIVALNKRDFFFK
jgi:hypothetical protein